MLKNTLKIIALFCLIAAVGCSDDDDNTTPGVEAPATYSFERDGSSTVSFSGQTTRIQMANELAANLKNFDKSGDDLQEMFANQTADGSDANPFTDPALNDATKSVRSKTAASQDYFGSNATAAAAIKTDFDTWIAAQADLFDVFQTQAASEGVPGQIDDGGSTRYVNEFGVEYDQIVVKGLIGALMVDQMLNNYLSPAVLDAASNRTDNDAGIVAEGEAYTTMEHKWDEAYGYLYGNAADAAAPNTTIGGDDQYLNKYLGRVIGDEDFAEMAEEIYDAFKLGRAAIVAGNYEVRDEQAAIIREKVSEIIGIRSVYYLQAGKTTLAGGDFGGGFHDLSEGLGFIYSLQFTRQPNSDNPYFTAAEVDDFFDRLLQDPVNGFWGVPASTLDAISEEIAAKFNFTVAQAAP